MPIFTENLISLPNGRLLLGEALSPNAVYRSAAASIATPEELSVAPQEMTWLDLRRASEQARDAGPALPAGWTVRKVDANPTGDMALSDAGSMVQNIIDGRATFGHLYQAMLENAADRLARAVSVVATATGPVLITCQIGRDRTGIISALLLLLTGATREQVAADYLRTNDAIEALRARTPIPAALDLTCRRADIELALDHLESRGGSERYLLDAGLDAADLDALRQRFFR